MTQHTLRATIRTAALAAGANVLVTTASAAVTSYTSSASFFADLASNSLIPATENFDAATAGTTIPDGGSVGGIGFNNFGLGSGTQLIIDNQFSTTSPGNYLGVDNAANSNLIIGGDTFSLSFSSSFAIGFNIITAETANFSIFDNDVQLVVPGLGTALLDVDAPEATLADGSTVYFLGLIDPAASFTGANIAYDPAAVNAMTYNIDDITTAIPEPSGAALLSLAGLGFLARRRRR